MPIISHVPTSLNFPKRADAVIIGAGIIGLSTALELQARGLQVVVLEKGEVAAEQSSRNWGWCRQMGRDPREIPLIKVSLELWRGMNAKLGSETGYRTNGILYLSKSESELAPHKAWATANVVQYGLSSRLISSGEAAELLPGCQTSWHGGLYTPDDGRAEPFLAVPAMAAYFQNKGGLIFTHCAARGFETTAGKVSSVVTERGAVATDVVVLAGGYWSERFLANHDVRFPQAGVISSVMRTSAVDLGHDRTFCGGAFAARKRLDGGYTIANALHSRAELTPNHLRYFKDFLPILKMDPSAVQLRVGKRFFDEWRMPRRWSLYGVSPFEQVRSLDPMPHHSLLTQALAELKTACPAFAKAEVKETWAGMIDVTPDAVPVIDQVAKYPGLFLASGFSGHGFGLGPGAGKLMAELVLAETPCVDPAPFRFGRFKSGVKAQPSSGL